MPNPVEIYLAALANIADIGTGETSGYPTLCNLLDAVGRDLKPRVRCIIHPKNAGAGLPDGALFLEETLKQGVPATGFGGPNPDRGAIEVKALGEDLESLIASDQARRYLGRYGSLLVTNYRQFARLERGPNNEVVRGEVYTIAASEPEFRRAAASPHATAEQHGRLLADYLSRVMRLDAPIAEPADVAWFLASYAREALARIEASNVQALVATRKALEDSLGMRFEGAKGEHFFRSTLVQTLFYGVFAAWVVWHEEKAGVGRFEWRNAAWNLHVPVIAALFQQVASPVYLKPLGLDEVLDWAGDVLNRVQPAFFDRFETKHAVQYFYEPFLAAFDPELRKQLGVWYTPPEIVQYMVARVDQILRDELRIADGLADPRVFVLDPCCGTGAYLVEVLKHVHRTAVANQGDALGAEAARAAAVSRVFGFEILPAPFVVSHLQLGMLLHQMGAPLDESQRAGVFLTNALTGWEPPKDEGKQRVAQVTGLFPEYEAERLGAERIKRNTPILVVIGNPPYNGYAGVAVEEERSLSDAYRVPVRVAAPQGQGLNDLYVRFFRMAERRITEQTGQGIVCFISNYSWLDGLSFTAMRERYLDAFDRIWIDNLHGDRIISEYAPDGRTSETVFAMEGSTPGIKVGTAIALLTRLPADQHSPVAEIAYRDMDHARAAERRQALLDSLQPESECKTTRFRPVMEIGLPFKPRALGIDYLSWPLLPDLFPKSFPGVKTSRDDVVVDIDRDRLEERMRLYFDPNVTHEQMRLIAPGAMESTARFDAPKVRNLLRARGIGTGRFLRYAYRPFDVRWLYWHPETKLLDEKRPDYAPHVFDGNVWLSAGQRNRKEAFYQPQYTPVLADHHIVESNVGMFPLYLAPDPLFDEGEGPRANLSDAATVYLRSVSPLPPGEGMGVRAPGADSLFYHALAVLHAPAYRVGNAGALRQDWPRVPLPAAAETLLASAELGKRIAALLDTETEVPGVTSGTVSDALRPIGILSCSPLPPGEGLGVRASTAGGVGPPDYRVTAGWGHAGKDGVTMPGRGRVVERAYTSEERAAMGAAADALGPATRDVYLNDTTYWANVPDRVWNYTIGGYQVLKKWLSYRETGLLGRPLRPEEAREAMNIARRIAAILLLEPQLDANYEAVKAKTYAWSPA